MSSVQQQLEADFEEFFQHCKRSQFSSAEMRIICRPLLGTNYTKLAKKVFIIMLILATLYALFNWVNCISWFASAIGRLLLIQLLPYWNWEPLYNSKCLIERASVEKEPLVRTLDRYETAEGNCVLCEAFDGIPTALNTTFLLLEEHYLERGLPVIVTDSHKPIDLQDFLLLMQTNTQHFRDSEPCDLATNLMLRKLFTIDAALQKIVTLDSLDKWFLQLRNCEFKAVKSSRLFVKRPYYYPIHLAPFYSSWILMSNHFVELRKTELYLHGLVFVQQLSGFFDIRLTPKRPCQRDCPAVNIRLDAGESLVFSTDMWIFSYGSGGSMTGVAETAIATILEIDWRT